VALRSPLHLRLTLCKLLLDDHALSLHPAITVLMLVLLLLLFILQVGVANSLSEIWCRCHVRGGIAVMNYYGSGRKLVR
jgi:hypothetical protein